MMIRLALVNNRNGSQHNLRVLLDWDSELEVVGEIEAGYRAIAAIEASKPDVVLMTLPLSPATGELVQDIGQKLPAAKVLILSDWINPDHILRTLQQGVSGYLGSHPPADDLIRAIKLVSTGHTVVGPNLMDQILAELPQNNWRLEAKAWQKLTRREQEVAQLIIQGSSNREIATSLHIAEKTAKNHVTNILNRLELRDRTQLIIMASKQR